MNEPIILKGGCLCGSIRYQVNGLPFASDHCHCRMCQKHTGAVVGTWIDVKTDQITWLSGEVSEYASSEFARRGFCAQCGSTMSFRNTRHPEIFSFALSTLDDPNQVRPTYHIFTDSQIEWLNIVDDCERYPRSRDNTAN